MFNCVIVDDEPLAIELISDYIERTDELKLINSFSNPIEAIQFLNETEVDLVFLDVQMPELTGIQFMKIFKGKFSIIFTTAYENYAVDGFEYDVIDYLLKPISFERFQTATGKVYNRLGNGLKKVHSSKQSQFIFVKTEYKTQKIDLNDIYYIEGLGDYIGIQNKKGQVLTLDSIKNFISKLPGDNFIQVHKSYIISLDKINYIKRNQIEINRQFIPIGETYKKAFWEKINGISEQ